MKDKNQKEIIKSNIDKFGCFIALFEADNYLPGFAYTIGLFEKYKHPEIICFGLNIEAMQTVLNHACDLIKNGEPIEISTIYSNFLVDYPIQFLEVNKDYNSNYMGYAQWYYSKPDIPFLQMVWTDKNKKFPWDKGFNQDLKFRQPLLDRNVGFKFYEEPNLGIFTTQQVLDGEPILFVFHNEDGDWQFHSSSEPIMNDARLVCLEEITKLDCSINEVYHLQYGFRASRNSIDSDWQFEKD